MFFTWMLFVTPPSLT
uniref:Uncharacterized protein n=1 Tax=Anguilla anguilla TaxID=7936 RepID=A0A0E9XZE1_ANGAN